MYSQHVAFVIDNRVDVLQCIASYVVIALLYRPYKNKTISVDHGMTTQLITAAVPAITSYVEFDENGKIILGNYDKVAIQLLTCNQLTACTDLCDQCMHIYWSCINVQQQHSCVFTHHLCISIIIIMSLGTLL